MISDGENMKRLASFGFVFIGFFLLLLVFGWHWLRAEEKTPSRAETHGLIPLVKVPAGKFLMGSPPDEPARENDETLHEVVITRPFYIGATEVTRKQWLKVKWYSTTWLDHSGLTRCDGIDCPADMVRWQEAIEFCNRLSILEGRTRCYSGKGDHVQWKRDCTGYRLPTEAEWEYAARAGTTTPFYTGATMTRTQANCSEMTDLFGSSPEPRRNVMSIRGFPPNQWGLYDMSGNLEEWVWDRYGDYATGPVVDPAEPASPYENGRYRVLRGGYWATAFSGCRSAARSRALGDPQHNEWGLKPRIAGAGFRVVRNAE